MSKEKLVAEFSTKIDEFVFLIGICMAEDSDDNIEKMQNSKAKIVKFFSDALNTSAS